MMGIKLSKYSGYFSINSLLVCLRISPCSAECSRSHSAIHAGLKLPAVLLPRLPTCFQITYRCESWCLALPFQCCMGKAIFINISPCVSFISAALIFRTFFVVSPFSCGVILALCFGTYFGTSCVKM